MIYAWICGVLGRTTGNQLQWLLSDNDESDQDNDSIPEELEDEVESRKLGELSNHSHRSFMSIDYDPCFYLRGSRSHDR